MCLFLLFKLIYFSWCILLRPIGTHIPIFLSFQAFPTHFELVSIFSTFIILPNHRIYFFIVFLFESLFYYLVPLLQLIYSSWIVAVFHLRESSMPLVIQVISYQTCNVWPWNYWANLLQIFWRSYCMKHIACSTLEVIQEKPFLLWIYL